MVTAIAVLISAAGGVGVGFGAHRLEPRLLSKPDATVVAPAASEAAPSAGTASLSASSSASSSSAPPGPDGSAAPAAAGSVAEQRSCVRNMFPSDSFSDSSEAGLELACSETSYVKLSEGLKKSLVNAGGGNVTGGMKEWSNLGFYSLAASAVIRGRCCLGASAPSLPDTPKPCDSLADQLAALAKVAKKGGKKGDAMAPLAGFEKSVRCILRVQQAKVFGDFGELRGGEGTTFEKTFARALK